MGLSEDECAVPYTVLRSDLVALLDYVRAEQGAGRVRVRSQRDMIGFSNPSFERPGADDAPDCWQRATDPGNEGGFAHAGFGHSGSSAEQLEITSYAGGGRRLLADIDRPECALPAQSGHTYRLSAWYQMKPYDTEAPPQVRLIAYVRSASTGAWRPLAESPSFPAASRWKPMTWETPPIPADAAALSGGVVLQSAGLLTVDDMMMIDVGP